MGAAPPRASRHRWPCGAAGSRGAPGPFRSVADNRDAAPPPTPANRTLVAGCGTGRTPTPRALQPRAVILLSPEEAAERHHRQRYPPPSSLPFNAADGFESR
ncbi:hypothetical protein NDU88_009265 [Pleurodeles waltl]|uniref:Uncharacterized protein n=1 Tax=Pleurodeles waltl TaxID=8319 RepID=A0AAV7RUR9_PLEWA|nr:hypothetical protein NDU88_002893 [Pleurodeles waltl]KAJ1156546.1 hypothetical protein NDU88_009265 [Pleurodeles waltl]